MEPIDYRNTTWKEIQDRISGLRYRVYQAWLHHGCGTTREISELSGIDSLTFRPRSTELFQLGFLTIHEDRPGHEGIYRACSIAEAQRNFLDRQAEAINPQLEMMLQ